MRIVFARFLSTPFLIGALAVFVYAWEHEGEGGKYMVPFLLGAALIWVFAPQINWWWYSRRPPALEPGIIQSLERYVPFYQRLSEPNKKRFRGRLALTRMSTDFTAKNMPDDAVPPDVESAIAVPSVIVTWTRPVFLFENLEKVIVSPGSFLSPQYPQYHSAETFEPESCLMFSVKAVMDAFIRPYKVFNVVLHEYVKAVFAKYGVPQLEPNDAIWQHIEKVCGWNREHIEATIGIEGVDPVPVAACIYLVFGAAFRNELPEWAKSFDDFFGQAAE